MAAVITRVWRSGPQKVKRREHEATSGGAPATREASARPVTLSGEVQKLLRGKLERRDGEWAFPGPDGRPYGRVHVTRVFLKASQGARLRDESTVTVQRA